MSERNPRRDGDSIGTEDDQDVEGTVPQVEDYPARDRTEDSAGRETNPDEKNDETAHRDHNR